MPPGLCMLEQRVSNLTLQKACFPPLYYILLSAFAFSDNPSNAWQVSELSWAYEVCTQQAELPPESKNVPAVKERQWTHRGTHQSHQPRGLFTSTTAEQSSIWTQFFFFRWFIGNIAGCNNPDSHRKDIQLKMSEDVAKASDACSRIDVISNTYRLYWTTGHSIHCFILTWRQPEGLTAVICRMSCLLHKVLFPNTLALLSHWLSTFRGRESKNSDMKADFLVWSQ